MRGTPLRRYYACPHATISNRFSLKMMMAFALVVAAACFANPLSAQLPPPGSTACFECMPGCEEGNGGRLCDWAGPGRLGGIECVVGSGPLPGNPFCFCTYKGGICEGASDDENSLLAQRKALDAVRWGEELPADGLFYVATRGEDLIVRRKCGGEAIGRIVVAENGNRSIVRAVG